ncbi:hypothetical protein J2S37_001045 [Corynebacterium felinum]|uniref:Uncharacterized protein n=1 Tax=Corynebacterium felinum TaxID=131318 RepID=A0ABU2B7C2_9CORY|nr:hypothetical protein [Corynebacterium felinum]
MVTNVVEQIIVRFNEMIGAIIHLGSSASSNFAVALGLV